MAIPVPLPLWARALVYIAQTVAAGVIYQQYDHLGEMQPTQATPDDPLADTWRRFVFHYENVSSADTADDEMFSIDIANITNGAVDSSWTAGDYSAVEVHLRGIVTAMAPMLSSSYRCDRIDSYIRAFNPYSVAKPFADSGPPEWTTVVNTPGTALNTVPPHACTTVTEMTPSRAHWGRAFTPTLGLAAYDPGGRLNGTHLSALVTAWGQAYASLMTAEYFPVVPVTMVSKQPVRALQVVTAVRADDVVDAHRSRRHKTATNRITYPV